MESQLLPLNNISAAYLVLDTIIVLRKGDSADIIVKILWKSYV